MHFISYGTIELFQRINDLHTLAMQTIGIFPIAIAKLFPIQMKKIIFFTAELKTMFGP